MPKKKVAVALSEWLLDELDTAAEQSRTSRSALVEEALADYVVRRRTRERDERFRREATLALEDMKSFAREYHADPRTESEPSSLEKLRALRAEGRGLTL
ncbi:MAG: ribbon-helix-helix protein, CopG family [Coriobacteriia bacterium]|nr:ribbon-helix-helix protein, CopG family [Coriobacteriia bacterium]